MIVNGAMRSRGRS